MAKAGIGAPWAMGAAMVLTALAGPPAAADEKSFTFRNSSGTAVSSLYVSPFNSSSWGDNRLRSGSLEPGGEVRVQVDVDANICHFDLRIEDSAGKPKEYWGLDLCTSRVVDYP